jgi:putative ABC transport system permease protein
MDRVELLSEAWSNLAGNKLRSGLTMLGIIIGVASVIAMVALGTGAQRSLVQSLERLGTNLLFVHEKALNKEERRRYAGRSRGLRYGDLFAIQQLRGDLTTIPVIQLEQTLKAGGRDFTTQMIATGPDYQELRNSPVGTGRFLLQDDLQNWRRVVVLGKDAAEKLFGSEPPLQQEVKIADQRFVVVGVMEPKGSVFGTNYDEYVFIPTTTAIRRFQGRDRLSMIQVYVPSREEMGEAAQQIHSLLVQRHQGVDDIRVRNQAEFLDTVNQTTGILRLVLGAIALVALLVGGIGIMNIMLVTVTERTTEIGLRRAIGANQRTILMQFLLEAVIMSLIGGLMGIMCGVGAAYGLGGWVAKALPGGGDWGAVVEPSAIVLAFSVAVTVGVFFGLYPAIKASSLQPSEALRHQ